MQQNLYFQFLSHLKAIKKDLAAQDELARLRTRLSVEMEAVPEQDLVFRPPSFKDVLDDPIRLLELVSFAGQVYSQERLVFYILIEEFKNAEKMDVRLLLTERLWNEYIVHGAKRQVSIEGRRYKRVAEGYAELCKNSAIGRPEFAPPTMFDAVQKEVKRSIEAEIFPRFLKALEAQWDHDLHAKIIREAQQQQQQEKPKGLKKLFSPRSSK
jgi:hypothetical protein